MDLEQPNLSIDDRSRTPSPPTPPTLPTAKLEQTTTASATTFQDSFVSEPDRADKAAPTPAPVAQLPEILLPALAKTLSPIQQILIFHQHEMLQRGRESSGNLATAAGGCDASSGTSKSSGGSSSSSGENSGVNLLPQPSAIQQPSTSIEQPHQQMLSAAATRKFPTTSAHNNRLEAAKLRQKQLKLKAKEGAGGGGGGSGGGGSQQEEGRFKCERCGKSYNWNYNLNRHMRFECGIGNRFQCGVCKRRFPHKQNAAIHLKRKHLLQMESAEEMLASGHIIMLSNIPKKSS